MPNLLFIGDIVGRPGRSLVIDKLPSWREAWNLDFVVANAENAAGGSGLTAAIANELTSSGVDAITLGDHLWDQRGFEKEISALEFVARPVNLPAVCPGKTELIVSHNGFRLGVLTVLGRKYLKTPGDCPFVAADRVIQALADVTDGIFVEVHAEATSEKVALGWYLDGRVTAVVGTHTHIPTADANVLPRGTGYLTDAGMTGPYQSVLGREVQPVVAGFLDGMPRRFPVAEGDVRMSGALISIDQSSGFCTKIEHVFVSAGHRS
jgi:metallophosphoesterase (TIGR00282 family)